MNKMLKLFSISKNWIKYNIISEDKLKQYYQDYKQKKINHNLEHYRIYFISQYLDINNKLSQKELIKILSITNELFEEEKDEVYSWLLKNRLSNYSFNYLVTYIENKNLLFSKRILKAKLERMLIQNPTNNVIEKCILEGDKYIHELLLRKDLSVKNLLLLSQKGSNKRIRNLSKNRIKKIKN